MRKAIYSLSILATCLIFATGCKTKKRYYETKVTSNNSKVDKNSVDITSVSFELDTIISRLNSLETSLNNLSNSVSSLQSAVSKCCSNTPIASISSVESRLSTLERNVGSIVKDGNNLIIEGCNLIVRDGNGDELGKAGTGNILVGRDRTDEFSNFYGREPIRTGRNNIVIGGGHQYVGSTGLLVGFLNHLESDGSAIFGCENTTKGRFSSVTGGTNNSAEGDFSSISGDCDIIITGRCDWAPNHTNWHPGHRDDD